MSLIERNGPRFVDDIQVCRSQDDDLVYVMNRRTQAACSGMFRPTTANIEELMKQCFRAGQEAKATELRNVIGLS